MLENIKQLKFYIDNSTVQRSRIKELYERMDQGNLDELLFKFKDGDPLSLDKNSHCQSQNVILYQGLVNFLEIRHVYKEGVTLINGYKGAKLYELLTNAKNENISFEHVSVVETKNGMKKWFIFMSDYLDISDAQQKKIHHFEAVLSQLVYELKQRWPLQQNDNE